MHNFNILKWIDTHFILLSNHSDRGILSVGELFFLYNVQCALGLRDSLSGSHIYATVLREGGMQKIGVTLMRTRQNITFEMACHRLCFSQTCKIQTTRSS